VITADFREIAFEDGPRKCEGLFRASISAFANIPRPSRNEIAQIDDLALGLYDSVSREARHYAASVLSKLSDVPPHLLRRLCDEAVDISAPLLISSQALSDIDLIALIGKHGLSHARVIARRKNVNPVIIHLVRLLNAKAAREIAERQTRSSISSPALDEVRHQLRTLMKSDEPDEDRAASLPEQEVAGPYRLLRTAALAPNVDAFPSALSHALGVSDFRARRICTAITYSDLLISLKNLDLSEEQAFFLTAALYPSQLFYGPAIRLFVDRYRAIEPVEAERRLQEWREQDARMAGQNNTPQSFAISR